MVDESVSRTDAQAEIHPAARLGPVHYTAADLARQVDFYREILGFKLHWRHESSAGLGAGGEDLLRLTEVPGARRAPRTTGLYHTAFLVPTRWELAQLLKRIAETRTPIQGLTDHGTHHAVYLPDAEGNGIELAWDRPQEEWPRSVQEMLRRNRGLAPEEVFAALDDRPWEGLDAGTAVGHVHLHVADLAATDRFYREVLGFRLSMSLGLDSALFFAAGDYHHHVGTNIWVGAGAPPPPPDAVGLRHFTVILPDPHELERVLSRLEEAGVAIQPQEDAFLVRDPSANGVLLTAQAGG